MVVQPVLQGSNWAGRSNFRLLLVAGEMHDGFRTRGKGARMRLCAWTHRRTTFNSKPLCGCGAVSRG